MPVVRINDGTFSDLQSIAKWFRTKTPSETIDLIVQETMEKLGMEREGSSSSIDEGSHERAMEFASAPALAFTKPLGASINGIDIQDPRWSSILLNMIAQVKSKGVEGQRLVRALAIPAMASEYQNEGYRYYDELGISFQGQSASDCWKEIDRLAKKWQIPVLVEFMWRETPKAQHPGRKGILKSGG